MVTTRSKRTLEDAGEEAASTSSKSRKNKQKRQKFIDDKSEQNGELLTGDEAALKDNASSSDTQILAHEDNSDSSADDSDESSDHNLQESAIPMHEKDPYEYICMAQSYHDRELENSLKKPAQQMDEDALEKVHNKEVKKCGTDKLASKRPGHKWILMRRSWIMFAEAIHGANYRSPNAFDMYIWNDWEGYGMMEIVENFIVDFREALSKTNQPDHLKDMWIPLVALVHWMYGCSNFFLLMHVDDGVRVAETIQLIGKAFISMLNSLDRASQLKPDSEFRDLPLVMALYLKFANDYNDEDMTHLVNNEESAKWPLKIVKYAQDNNIDLVGSGLAGVGKQLDTLKVQVSKQKAWNKPSPDRWGFKRAYKRHEDMYGGGGISMRASTGLGGTDYDITKMPRKKRAQYAFDKKDPLADFTDDDLKNNRIALVPKY